MKINIIKYVGMLALALGFVACNPGEFGNLNIDPNNTSSPQPSLVFTSVMRAIPGTLSPPQGLLYAQHLAQTQYTDADRYDTERFNYGWVYTGPLANLEFLIEYNTNPDTKDQALSAGSNDNQIAVARILKAYFYNFVTDRWGDVPYSEALGALNFEDQNFQPVFDDQSTIYSSLFTELDQAVDQINLSEAPVEGDILFGGDLTRWRQFANTLRLLMALRISDVDPSKALNEFSAAMGKSGGVIGSGEDIFYTYLNEQNNDNPWEDRFETREDWAVSNTIMKYLNLTTERTDAADASAFGLLDAEVDPRRAIYANPSVTGAQLYGNAFIGMPYGVNEAIAGSYTNDEVSLLGSAVRQQDSPGYIFTVAQVHFALAEAIIKGWSVPGTVQAHYEAGINASMDQYALDIGNYMSNSTVAFDASKQMEQVLTQRWLASFLQGYPAWATWRRTNIPALVPAIDAKNNSGEIPVREGYPTTERDLNGTNYKAANERQGITGTNMLDVRVWWDVADNF